MPELPEVETMRRGIAGVVGSKIAKVALARCRKRPIAITPPLSEFRRRAEGRKIVEVGRVGKRMLLKLDSGDTIVLEPRMSGLVLIGQPPTTEHLRLRLTLSGGAAAREILYWDRRGLGSVRLVTPDEFEARYGAETIGPDALAASTKTLKDRLCGSQRPIKVALLDQRAIAGIGNLYAAEILHLARIHPELACCELSQPQWTALHRATRQVLRAAIRSEGSTLSDRTYQTALAKSGRYQNRHRVYARAGKLCTSCGRANIERMVQAQRSTYFCPACQLLPKSARPAGRRPR